MKTFSLSLIMMFLFATNIITAQDSTTTNSNFIGQWTTVDYLVDGITDVDAVAEMDSTTYWFHADGALTFCPHRYPTGSDSSFYDGVWEYHEKRNVLVLKWDKEAGGYKNTWEVLSINENTLVLKLHGSAEMHLRKIR